MTKAVHFVFLTVLLPVWTLFAQESSAPTESPTPTPSLTAEETLSPSPSPSTSAVRNVPLRFVPPPMEGTISLGIWDSNDKLVRVLHRESKIDNFTIDENALKTTWDGKSDAGEDLPAGKYRARGYLIGKLKIEDAGKAESPPVSGTDRISVKLVTNPLINDTRAVMEVAAGFDSKGSYLKTTDNLPLATINEAPNITRVLIDKDGEKAANVWLDDGTGIKHLRVSNIDKMMAFDCGFFDLR